QSIAPKSAWRTMTVRSSQLKFPNPWCQGTHREGSRPQHLQYRPAFVVSLNDAEPKTGFHSRCQSRRSANLRWGLNEGIQYVEHAEGHGDKPFAGVCNLGLEGIVSKRLTSVYKSGPSKTWIKVKNPKSPAATRAKDSTF